MLRIQLNECFYLKSTDDSRANYPEADYGAKLVAHSQYKSISRKPN
jgi:hypothetical protein